MSGKHIVILKNDAVGDLVHSLKAINNIVKDPDIKRVTIYLSKLSKKFNFLFDNPKIKFKVINYNLSFIEKIKLFLFLLFNKIFKIYILAPKNFYYFLPLFFFNTKFYAVCVDNLNGYKRPSPFLRKFLHKYVINDRSAIFKRKSTSDIQNELTYNANTKNNKFVINVHLSSNLKKYLPSDYIYFHAKKKILKELGWGIHELKLLFNEFLKYSENIVITKDVEFDENTKIFKQNFNSFDFKSMIFINKSHPVIFFDNIDGKELYSTIIHSKKIIAFHGMMTNLGSINKHAVLDLFHCKINNWNDYRNYRNSFYEFKPKYQGYDFIIPSKNINKTLRKIEYSLKK